MGNVSTNGQGSSTDNTVEPGSQLTPEMIQKITEIRSHVQETFGKVVLALMTLPRYRNLGIGDLQHLVLEPLLRDRLAIAYVEQREAKRDMAGFAMWASVSEEANARIHEQVRAGVFPVRLRPEDWNSGEINWLLDVVAPNKRVAASVIASFNKVTKGGALRLHPLVSRLVEPEILEKMGAEKLSESALSGEGAE